MDCASKESSGGAVSLEPSLPPIDLEDEDNNNNNNNNNLRATNAHLRSLVRAFSTPIKT